ncbi:MAG: zf-HC2 domain-containing protein [Acidobacteriaceae bacterium]
MDCASFESLLTDALDGLLTPAKRSEFQAHAGTCARCGPMFAEIEQGMAALRSLEEINPPEGLVHNVLARTSYANGGLAVRVPGSNQGVGLWKRMREGIFRPVLQPRFAMSLGMAFFSITLILNVAGITKKDLVNLRPATLRTTAMVKLNEAEGHVLKYYQNLRVVYEFESLVRNVKKNEKPAEKPPGKQNDTSQARPPAGAGSRVAEVASKLNFVGPGKTRMQYQQRQEMQETRGKA